SLALFRGQVESDRRDVERALKLTQPSPSVASPKRSRELESAPAWRVHTGIEYALRLRGDEGMGHGPGALFALLRANRGTRLGARLHLLLLLPARPSRREVELDLH